MEASHGWDKHKKDQGGMVTKRPSFYSIKIMQNLFFLFILLFIGLFYSFLEVDIKQFLSSLLKYLTVDEVYLIPIVTFIILIVYMLSVLWYPYMVATMFLLLLSTV